MSNHHLPPCALPPCPPRPPARYVLPDGWDAPLTAEDAKTLRALPFRINRACMAARERCRITYAELTWWHARVTKGLRGEFDTGRYALRRFATVAVATASRCVKKFHRLGLIEVQQLLERAADGTPRFGRLVIRFCRPPAPPEPAFDTESENDNPPDINGLTHNSPERTEDQIDPAILTGSKEKEDSTTPREAPSRERTKPATRHSIPFNPGADTWAIIERLEATLAAMRAVAGPRPPPG